MADVAESSAHCTEESLARGSAGDSVARGVGEQEDDGDERACVEGEGGPWAELRDDQAPMAGPMARERLRETLLSAAAWGNWSRGARSVMSV